MSTNWILSVHSEVEELAEAFSEIEANGGATLFQSADWLTVWYRAAGRQAGTTPVIVAARRPETDLPAVIMPLALKRKGPIRCLEFADGGVSDRIAPAALPGALANAGDISAIMAGIRETVADADLFFLDKISRPASGENPFLEIPGVREKREGIWTLPITPDWREQSRARRDSNFWTNLSKATRGLERDFGGYRVEIERDPDRLPHVVDELMAVRGERFSSIGRVDAVADPAWQNFYRDLAAARHRRIEPYALRLFAGDQHLAYTFGARIGTIQHIILLTHREGVADNRSPGLQALFETIADAAERGVTTIDFGTGDQRHKRSFGSSRQTMHDLAIPFSPRGWPAFAEWRVRAGLRRHPTLRRILRRITGKGGDA